MQDMIIPIKETISLKMIWCETTPFFLGGNLENRYQTQAELPQIRVSLSHGYWLSATPLTIDQLSLFEDLIPERVQIKRNDSPVWFLNWYKAREYCHRLTHYVKSQNLLPVNILARYAFDLPTEAQWEYACKAGTQTTWFFGEDEALLDEYAWYNVSRLSVAEFGVAQKKPNTWGFYDQYGLIGEWCRDNLLKYDYWTTHQDPFIDDSIIELVKQKSDLKLKSGAKVIRGGHLWSKAKDCRSSKRHNLPPSIDDPEIGFRIALVPTQDVIMTVSKNT